MSKISPNPKKAALRMEVGAKLATMARADIERQSNIVVEKALNHPKYKAAKRIALFLSLPTEVDTTTILEDILSRGDAAFVPQYSKGVMNMLRVLPGDLDTMVSTSCGIKQHAKTAVRENALEKGGLDLVIAPGAAFTPLGWRCGHGGGYYDRFLTELLRRHKTDPGFSKPYILAVGFTQQMYDQIPVDPHDVKVDEVVTALS